MANNLRLVPKNAADAATLTASPAVETSLPVSNLQNILRARIMRTTSAAAQTISGTWGGTGYPVNMAAILRHNIESAGTWRVQLYSDAAWTTQIYDSGNVTAIDSLTLGELDWGVSPLGSGLYDAFLGQRNSAIYFPEVTAVSFKITITDTGNSAGYIDVSRLWLGQYIAPAYNVSYGLQLAWRDNTTQVRTDGGSLRSDGGQPWREIRFSLDALPEADRSAWSDVFRYAGRRLDVFVSVFPESGGEIERDYMMAAKFSELPTTEKHVFQFYRAAVTLEEA